MGHAPATQGKSTHAALHSSELLPALVYQYIVTSRSWCRFSCHLLTHSPSEKETFLLSLYSQDNLYYEHTRENTSSHIGSCLLCYSFASIATAALNNLSCTNDIKSISKKRINKVVFLQIFGFQTLSVFEKEAGNTIVHETVTSTIQNKAVANQRTVCECVSTVKSNRKSLLVLMHNSWTGIHTVLQWDTNGCRSTDMSNISNIFLSASLLQIEQSDDLEHADIPHKAVIISEADQKCEMNNHLFQICSMLHEGNKLCRKFNASGQEWTFFWMISSEPEFSISVWKAAEEDLISTKWQITQV